MAADASVGTPSASRSLRSRAARLDSLLTSAAAGALTAAATVAAAAAVVDGSSAAAAGAEPVPAHVVVVQVYELSGRESITTAGCATTTSSFSTAAALLAVCFAFVDQLAAEDNCLARLFDGRCFSPTRR